jgi:uncharacterized protein YndB with AHSA1/START domain
MTGKKADTMTVTTVSDQELVAERVFDAPRQLVFDAWTKPEHLKRWFGPKDWTLPVCEVDFRVGGVWLYCMRSPDGSQDSWGRAVYREIVAPERIVYVDSFADKEGNPVPGMPEMVITVEFSDHEGKTKVTSRTLFASAAERDSVLDMGVIEGLTETWDRLAEYLATR